MNCMEARALVEDALDESLAGSRKRALDLHLSRCDACRAFLGMECSEHRRWFLAMNEQTARRRLPQGFVEGFLAVVAERHAKPLRRWAFLAAIRRVAAVVLAMAAFAGLVYAAASGLRGTEAANQDREDREAANQGGSRLSSNVSSLSEASADQIVADASATTTTKGAQSMKPKKAGIVALAATAATLSAAPLSLADVADETTDFWDTSGRSADVTSSVVSSGDASAYFETEHESSSEVSAGRNINTFPSTGVIFIVR